MVLRLVIIYGKLQRKKLQKIYIDLDKIYDKEVVIKKMITYNLNFQLDNK